VRDLCICTTLLIISLSVPDKNILVSSNAYALQTLIDLYSGFEHYALAFLILGTFWLSLHMQFHPCGRPTRYLSGLTS